MATENTHYGAAEIGRLLRDCNSVYFIGIGGINMSSLAHLTHRLGFRVGGSDRTRTALTDRLIAEGICVYGEHRAEQTDDYDAVVYTVAISEENPEYQAARLRGIPLISRADYMGYLMMRYPRRIGVSGMHGKSSCTSMCAHALMGAGKDPTVLSGAELAEMGGAYRLGEGEDFLFEACEYMDSFLDFNPTVAVILNIEMDHVDYFKSMEQIRRSFGLFASRTGKDGYAVVNGDDGEVLDALKGYEGNLLTFGIERDDADYRATELRCERGRYSFDLLKRGELFAHVELTVSGRHHVYNALAAAAVCDLCGVTPKETARLLGNFGGAARRMERKGLLNGAEVFDDYGHHPTEIRATLEGARGLPAEGGRLFCVYQPHTYSRTHALMDGFATAFEQADRVFLMDIYAARETNEFGVSSALLTERIGEKAVYGGSPDQTAKLLRDELREGDTVIIMGAGDIYKIYDFLEIKQ